MGICQGMQMTLLRGEDREEHWHSEIDVFFTAQGCCRIQLQGRTVEMGEEDIFLVNSSVPHSLSCTDSTVLCNVKYPWKVVSGLLGTSAVLFRCSSPEDRDRSYSDVRRIFRALVYYYLREPRKTDCLLDSHLLKLLDCLTENYLVELPRDGAGKLSDQDRLQQIFQYVNQNYREGASLTQLAEQMFLSPSALSRFFKRETGMGFVEYVNHVRAHTAALELEQTEENVTKIAVNCGFSNLSTFNRVFREHYGISPTEYRHQRREARREEAEKQRRYVASIREQYSRAEVVPDPGSDFAERHRRAAVEADVRTGIQQAKVWNHVINIGPVSMLFHAEMQNHILILAEAQGFTYVRLWDVLSCTLMMADGEHIGSYNFGQLDAALDFLLSHRIMPWLDFGRRPDTITRDEKGVVVQEDSSIVFRSRRAWEHLLRSLIRHLVNRYGRAVVDQWIFEFSYIFTVDDRDACYHDDSQPFSFADAFCFFFQTIREQAPAAKVGGPGAIPGWLEDRQRSFLEECQARGCAPDFWSVFLYPYQCEAGQPSPVHHRSSDIHTEEKQIQHTREFLREAGMEECKLFVSEWNITVSDRDYLNDSTYRAAYLAQKLPKFWNEIDLVAVSLGSDLVGSHYDTYRVVSGGMGLLTRNGIRKPAFFTLQFFNSMGLWIVDQGENHVVTRTSDGSLFLLCTNQKHFNSQYYMRSEGSFEPGRLDELFEDLDPIELTFRLDGMPEGAVCAVKVRTISSREGNILGEWEKLQFETDLKPHDIHYLRQACYPRLTMFTSRVQEGVLEVKQTVQPNEVVLIHIYARD